MTQFNFDTVTDYVSDSSVKVLPSELRFSRITSSSLNGITIAGLAPVMNHVTVTHSAKSGISIGGFTSGLYVLTNCELSGNVEHGIYITDDASGNYVLSNCNISDNSRIGIQMSQRPSNYLAHFYITNSYVLNNGIHGIEMSGYSNLTLSNSSIYGNVNSGLEVHPNNAARNVDVYVEYCNVSSNGFGLVAYDSWAVSQEIRFNVIVSNLNGGVYCRSIRQCVVQGNNISHNTGQSAAEVRNSGQFLVQSNIISHNTGRATAQVWNSEGVFGDNVIENNVISSCCVEWSWYTYRINLRCVVVLVNIEDWFGPHAVEVCNEGFG